MRSKHHTPAAERTENAPSARMRQVAGIAFHPWVASVVVYAVGAVGLLTPFAPLFARLTPLLLTGACAVLLATQAHRTAWLYAWAAAVAVLGYAIEVLGVKTGAIFGEYSYSGILGPRVLGVPLTIGLNWLQLSLIFGGLAQRLVPHWLARAALAALGMVLLDVLLEPAAIALDFWQWAAGTPPLQNYLGWFLCAAAMQAPLQYRGHRLHSPWALPLLVGNALFFLITLLWHG